MEKRKEERGGGNSSNPRSSGRTKTSGSRIARKASSRTTYVRVIVCLSVCLNFSVADVLPSSRQSFCQSISLSVRVSVYAVVTGWNANNHTCQLFVVHSVAATEVIRTRRTVFPSVCSFVFLPCLTWLFKSRPLRPLFVLRCTPCIHACKQTDR